MESSPPVTQSNPFKIVGLIASVITTLACFVGAVTWISINLADNKVSIEALKEGQLRHETQIYKNAEVARRIDQHESSLKILTEFMTQGGRFTETDGRALYEELRAVKERLRHYEILETELSWIKKSIGNLERDIRERFDSLDEKITTTSDSR